MGVNACVLQLHRKAITSRIHSVCNGPYPTALTEALLCMPHELQVYVNSCHLCSIHIYTTRCTATIFTSIHPAPTSQHRTPGNRKKVPEAALPAVTGTLEWGLQIYWGPIEVGLLTTCFLCHILYFSGNEQTFPANTCAFRRMYAPSAVQCLSQSYAYSSMAASADQSVPARVTKCTSQLRTYPCGILELFKGVAAGIITESLAMELKTEFLFCCSTFPLHGMYHVLTNQQRQQV